VNNIGPINNAHAGDYSRSSSDFRPPLLQRFRFHNDCDGRSALTLVSLLLNCSFNLFLFGQRADGNAQLIRGVCDHISYPVALLLCFAVQLIDRTIQRRLDARSRSPFLIFAYHHPFQSRNHGINRLIRIYLEFARRMILDRCKRR
jgi:hypothetical protein